jgi:hypothetical protein
MDRKLCYDNDIKARNVDTYSLDTCIISYKRRRIDVPSNKYPNIDCALQTVKSLRGGYVIKLSKGTHCLSEDIIGNVDHLHIIGDTNPFVGVGYINGSGIKFFTDPLLPKKIKKCDSDIIGIGPFTLSITGRKIIVKGSVKDPDFTCLESGRTVTFFFVDGSTYNYNISSVCKNTITLNDNLTINIFGPSQQLNLGEGFIINPNVTLTTNLDVVNILPTEYINLEGLLLNVGYINLGMPTTRHVEISHCVLPKTAQIFLHGNYFITKPNVFNGIVNLTTGSRGTAYYQTFVGEVSRLVADGCSPSAWKFSVYASSSSPVKLLNGSNINFQGSHFVNNCLGLYVADGSHATIYSCVFNSNKFGLLAIYDSVVSARTSFYLASFNIPPIFVNNTFALIAEWGSYIVIQKACFCNNIYHAILDSRVYVTIESLPVGQYGQEHSLILETLNPSAVDAGNTGCASSNEQGSLTPVSDNFLGIDALSIVSRSVITGETTPTLPTSGQSRNVTRTSTNSGQNLINAPTTTASSGTSSTSTSPNVGSAVTNSANIISIPNAIGSGFQQRNFLNMFGPVPPESLISFLGCQGCNHVGSS